MLKLEDLQVYYGGIHALQGISLEVPDGKIVSLIGANGAGKSTTLNSIVGLVKTHAGKISWNDADLTIQTTQQIVSQGMPSYRKEEGYSESDGRRKHHTGSISPE